MYLVRSRAREEETKEDPKETKVERKTKRRRARERCAPRATNSLVRDDARASSSPCAMDHMRWKAFSRYRGSPFILALEVQRCISLRHSFLSGSACDAVLSRSFPAIPISRDRVIHLPCSSPPSSHACTCDRRKIGSYVTYHREAFGAPHNGRRSA